MDQAVYDATTEDRYAGFSGRVNVFGKEEKESFDDIEAALLGKGKQGEATSLPPASEDGTQAVADSWVYIDKWLEERHEDDDRFEALAESCSDPDTKNDIAEAQLDLGVELPRPVIRSLLIHDGQEMAPISNRMVGLIFGYPLLSLDEIVQTTKVLRRVASREAKIDKSGPDHVLGQTKKPLQGDSNLMTEDSADQQVDKLASKFIQDFPKQASVPKGAIKPVYMNANWIPLVSDHSGNQIGVDLDPDTEGVSGQVILYGRDYDTKYVIAENWGQFLSIFVNDLKANNWTPSSHDDLNDYDLAFAFKGRELDYLDVLKSRAIQAAPAPAPAAPAAPAASKPAAPATSAPEQTPDAKE